jgi:hypothetical protein
VPKSSQGDQPGSNETSRETWIKTALIGAGVVIASAVAAIVLFTAFGGSSVSEGDPERPDIPALGEAPVLPRSDAADLLESKSFDEMTADEIALVKAEAERVFGDGEFRASGNILGAEIVVDIIRRQGQTIASRQYRFGPTADEDKLGLVETIIFFCPTADGGVDAYRADKAPLETQVRYDRQLADQQPYDKEFSAGDWSQPRDLGFDEVNGRRVHGVEVLWGGTNAPWQMWFDVETAQMLRRNEVTEEEGVADKAYIFDYGRPPRIEPPPELDEPACLDEVYPQG